MYVNNHPCDSQENDLQLPQYIMPNWTKEEFDHMWKQIFKMILKLLVLLVPFTLGCSLSMSLFPMRFMDGEYAWYYQNREYSEAHNDYTRVLIMGDSVSKAAWLPELLSDDTYNFALGGASPIEEYYYLRDYLEKNEAPEYVIYTTRAVHLTDCSTFWGRSVYFHRFNFDNICELDKEMEQYDNADELKLNNAKKDYMEYFLYSPTKYGSAFIKGAIKEVISCSRYADNMKKYEAVIENKGQTQFGMAEYCDEIYEDAESDSFEANEIINTYFEKLIELCKENNIVFVLQNPPYNESTYEVLKERFVNDYTFYLESLAEKYPNINIDTELFYYGNEYFGDSSHLNYSGTVKFSNEMRKKYSYIFDEKKCV